MSNFNQGTPTVPSIVSASNIFLVGNTTSGTALSVQQLGAGGTVASFSNATGSVGLFVSSTSQVGVGTTNPQTLLHVTATASNSAIFIDNSITGGVTPYNTVRPSASGAGSANCHIWSDGNAVGTSDAGFLRIAAGGGTAGGVKSYIDLSGYSTVTDMNQNIVLGTSGSEKMRITSAGYVGIGSNNPQYVLDISGTARINTGTSNIILGSGQGAGQGALYVFPQSSVPGSSWNIGAGLQGGTANAIAFVGGTNVGIGTTDPATALQVAGDLLLSQGAAKFGYNSMAIQYDGNTNYGSIIGKSVKWDGTNYIVQSDGATPRCCAIQMSWDQGFRFITTYASGGTNATLTPAQFSSNIKMVITNGGNVGIGTASPGALLDVYGTTSGASTTSGCITNSGGSLNLNAGVNAVYFATQGVTRVYVNGSSLAPNADNLYSCGASSVRWNAVWAVNGTIQTSDSRYKDSVPLTYGLKEILQANTILYSWKTQASLPDSDPEKNFKYFGVCADELVSIMPELCYNENSNVAVQINYAELMPVLINAIKELSSQVTTLSARLAALEARA